MSTDPSRFVWLSNTLCLDLSRVVSAHVKRAPLPRYSGQFLGGRRDVVLTLDTGATHTVIAVDEDNRRRGYESAETAEQRDRVEAAARAWIDGLFAIPADTATTPTFGGDETETDEESA